MAAKDLTNNRFGRLVALEDAGKHPTRGLRAWRCACDCGNQALVVSADLVHGRTTSCGCLRHEMRVARGKLMAAAVTTHAQTVGRKRTPEYVAWLSMRQRCSDPKHLSFENYGGRGVRVCERWENSFAAFLSDMGTKPTRAHSLDRFPNRDGNYEPTNCRWATQDEQQNNRRDNSLLTLNGETLTQSQWAKRAGVSGHAMKVRAQKFLAGQLSESEVLLPAHHTGQHIEIDGVRMPLHTAAQHLGITYQGLRLRLKAYRAGIRSWADVTAKKSTAAPQAHTPADRLV